MNLAELSEAFLKHAAALGQAPSTVTQRRSHLRRLLWHLEKLGVTRPHELLREHLESFIEDLTWAPARSRLLPVHVRTRNGMLGSAKAFCRWLYEQNHAAADAAQKVEYAREPETLPRNVPSEEQVEKLLAAPDGQTLLGFRDRTILELLYATGVRVSELVGLDVADVDLETRFVRVRHGKGNKERVVPLGERAAATVASYIAGVRPLLANGDVPALLFSKYGRRLGTKSVEVLVSAYAKTADLPHLTPHALRHACATHMLRRGAQLRHLQELLGHADVTTTEIYTRLTNLELIEAHRRFHPREQGDPTKPAS